jgi:hypothetical protein
VLSDIGPRFLRGILVAPRNGLILPFLDFENASIDLIWSPLGNRPNRTGAPERSRRYNRVDEPRVDRPVGMRIGNLY